MPIRKILISQTEPKTVAAYDDLRSKYGVQIDFAPFYRIEPLSSIEMRSQHCNVLDYDAIVFSARSTIDAFFSICEQLRVKVPETMKYFCTNEKVAMYLQKHIVYRKRKIFYGDGTPASVTGLVTAKHQGDNFLIVTTSDSTSNSVTRAFDATTFKHSVAVFAKPVPYDIKSVDFSGYDVVVLYSKADVAALRENFPDFKQDKLAFITYGSESVKKAIDDAGWTIALSAPAPNCPSVAAAIEQYILSKQA